MGQWGVGVLVVALLVSGSAKAQVVTAQADNARTNANVHEMRLRPANVNAASFGKLYSRTVDGDVFAQPLFVPKGTKFVWDMTWDNSAQNLANPDPTKAVHWGDQTWDEMGIGYFGFRYTDETAESYLAERAAKEKAIQEAAKPNPDKIASN